MRIYIQTTARGAYRNIEIGIRRPSAAHRLCRESLAVLPPPRPTWDVSRRSLPLPTMIRHPSDSFLSSGLVEADVPSVSPLALPLPVSRPPVLPLISLASRTLAASVPRSRSLLASRSAACSSQAP